MDNNDKDEKVILKRSALPGVDMSVVDLELVSTVKVRVTIVKKVMYKIRRQTFIGTRDQLDDLDVIQLGALKRKYRVMKLVRLDDYGGYIYRIKRIDGEPTIGIDIDNANTLGQKVSIVNRPTFDDLFNYACSMKECIPDPVTVDLCNTDSCNNLGLPIEPVDPPVDPPVDNRCLTSTVFYGLGDVGRTTYTNCSGERVFVESDGSTRNPVSVNICIAPNPNYVFTGTEPTITVTDVECTDPVDPPETRCLVNRVTIPPDVGDRSFTYTNCAGDRITIIVPDAKQDLLYTLCVFEVPDYVFVNIVGETIVDQDQECIDPPPPEPCSSYQIEVVGGNTGALLNYIDCEGNPVSRPLLGFESFSVCGEPGQNLECTGACKGFESTETPGGCN